MRHMKKLLCAALAAFMMLMGTSCNVLLEPESPETVTEKTPTGNHPSGGTPGEADSVGGNPAETAPSESEKGEETEEVTIKEEITEEVTTVEVITEEVTTVEEITEEVTTAHVHAETVLEGVAPTCTETGLTEGVLCGECGEMLVEQEEVPAIGHTLGDWIVDKEADIGIDGRMHATCTVCSDIIRETIKGYSQGLDYTLNEDGTYCVSGIGTCTDLDILISPTYNGERVTSIGWSAFSGCSDLNSIIIPGSVTSIDGIAFMYCSGLTFIVIPDSVTNIGPSVFANCSGLTEITVVEGNPVYHSDGNCLIETERKTLIAGCMNSVIPADGSVTNIGDYAFCGSSGLTAIVIPDSVTSIGNEAFRLCGLTSIVIPDGVTHIADQAFGGCTSLTSVTIPDSVTSISMHAFSWCTSLSSIDIPDSVTSIGSWAFGDCSSLTFIDIPDGVVGIEAFAFAKCSDLSSVIIPNSVVDISGYAFHECISLTDIYFTGTEEEWEAITKGSDWDFGTPDYTLHFNYVP